MNKEEAKELVKGLHESRKQNKDIIEVLEESISTLKQENRMFRELQHRILEDIGMREIEKSKEQEENDSDRQS